MWPNWYAFKLTPSLPYFYMYEKEQQLNYLISMIRKKFCMLFNLKIVYKTPLRNMQEMYKYFLTMWHLCAFTKDL